MSERTAQEREHALVERQLARQAHISRKVPRHSKWQFILAAAFVLAAVVVYATDAAGWYTTIVCCALVLCAGAALA